MKESIKLLENGFESSSGLTPEFAEFFKVFKKEFTSELKCVGATNIKFTRGHFYVSGFFTVKEQVIYFSLSDVRDFAYSKFNDPNCCMCQLLYRTAKDYKDYTGGQNRYAKIEFGMIDEMAFYFNI